jgi:hypothetical protein
MAECCDFEELGDSLGASGIQSYGGCRIAYRTAWEGYFEHLLEQSSKAGRLAFNQAAFTACMVAVKGLSCADYANARGADLPDCMAMFEPKVALGGACTNTIECVEGRCEVPDNAAEGTCIKLPGEGEPCLDGRCGEGVRCENQVCVPYLTDGAACDSNSDCDSSFCKKADPMSPTGSCVRLCQGGGPGLGPVNVELETLGPALVSAVCEKMSACCTLEETAEFLFSSSLDETKCRGLYAALYGSFALPLLNKYEMDGQLEIDGVGWLGCVEAFNAKSCEEHSKSTSLEPACPDFVKPKVADGGACPQDVVCISGDCDQPNGSSEDGTCKPLPGPGAPCNDECVEGHYCDAGACVPQEPLGASCSLNDECAEGVCYEDPTSGAKTCAYICDGK